MHAHTVLLYSVEAVPMTGQEIHFFTPNSSFFHVLEFRFFTFSSVFLLLAGSWTLACFSAQLSSNICSGSFSFSDQFLEFPFHFPMTFPKSWSTFWPCGGVGMFTKSFPQFSGSDSFFYGPVQELVPGSWLRLPPPLLLISVWFQYLGRRRRS